MCTGAEPEAAAATAEGAKGAGEVAATTTGTEATAATATEATAATMPAATAEAGGAGAVEAGAAGTSGAATTGSDVLGTIKTLAPVVSAGANLIGAGAAYAQAQAAKNMPVPRPGAVDEAQVQKPVDPDLTAIRKRNALLFGLDSPGGTDLTKGSAGPSNLGRVTLLGG